MGLFDKKNTSVYDFERQLKSDPDFMLKVLNVIEKQPSLEQLKKEIKKLGYDIDVSGMLDAIKNALEFYKSMSGDSPSGGSSNGGSSNGGTLAGFKQ